MTPKLHYLASVRANSVYPVYRGFIGTIALLGYLLAALVGLGALIGGLTSMSQSFMLGLTFILGGALYAALLFLMARFFKEAALILADIGDCVADANSRPQIGGSATIG